MTNTNETKISIIATNEKALNPKLAEQKEQTDTELKELINNRAEIQQQNKEKELKAYLKKQFKKAGKDIFDYLGIEDLKGGIN